MSNWLSLSAAAELLGVHPSTVRLWSDKGMLPVHRTKGGHRRYKRDEVMLWAQTAREVRTVQPEDLMQSAVRNVRIQVTEGRLEAESWYQKLDEEARSQYRQSSRSLFQGLMNFLASTNEDADSEAFAVGYEYASRARRYNLSYVDATRAFMFFRNVLIESVMKVYSEANIPSGKAWEKMLGKMHTFTDQILISLLDTYQALEMNSNGKG
ncbi:MAG: helix-turn-helix domain-containing protein [Anaerolineales bacterium]|jgi:excisionase family DNA binding protein